MQVSRKLARPFLIALAFGGTVDAQRPPRRGGEAYCPFDATTVFLDPCAPPFRRMADLDRDGDLDAVGWRESQQGDSMQICSYLNDGAGGFQTSHLLSRSDTSRVPNQLLGEIGLLDAGNVPDLCLVHGNQRHFLFGNGNGSFAPGPIEALPLDARAITLADLDADGRDDFVWVDASHLQLKTASGLQSSIAHGMGDVLTVRVLLRDGPDRRFLHRDGGQARCGVDAFLVHGDTSVALFYGSPTIGLVPSVNFLHGMTMTMFDTGDVDGDGDVDAVVFGMKDYRVLRRLNAGTWNLEPAAAGGPAQFLRDVDGDGDLDGACCAGGGPTFECREQPSPFEIALNDGSGAFAPAFAIMNVGSPELAGVADVDGDGDIDLVAGSGVYYAKGAVRPPLAAPPGTVVPNALDAREIADCNGDGYPDVGFTLDSAFLNDGAGFFHTSTHSVSGTPAGTTLRGPGFPGDFDGDGDLDLLVEQRTNRGRARPGRAPGHGRPLVGMALLANDGYGALSFGGPASVPGKSFALDSLEARASLTADLDADGDLDLVTNAMEPQTIGPVLSRLWVNDGAGSFDAAPFRDLRRIEAITDLDLDGRLDLAVTQYPPYFGLPRVWILHASGPVSPPTFVGDVQNWVGRLALGTISVGNLASADCPDPGYPDLLYMGCCSISPWLTMNGDETSISSWGSGIFDFQISFIEPFCRVGDLNLDGRDDFLSGRTGVFVKLCIVHTKVGPLAFDGFEARTQVLPPGQLVDLDQDGDLDLLGEQVVRNRTIP